MIESNCSWAVPTDTWTNKVKHITTDAEKTDPTNDYNNSDYTVTKTDKFLTPKTETSGCRVPKATFKSGPVITKPRPWEVLHSSDVPSSWDWGNVNGTNYLTWTRT